MPGTEGRIGGQPWPPTGYRLTIYLLPKLGHVLRVKMESLQIHWTDLNEHCPGQTGVYG